MTKNLFARLLAAASILAGCTQLPQSSGATATTQARYVEAAALTSSPSLNGGQVITVVRLRYITAAEAEASTRARLPAGVLIARIGESSQVVLQGPDHGVAAAIATIQRLDIERLDIERLDIEQLDIEQLDIEQGL